MLEPSRIQAGDLARADRACGHKAKRRRRCRQGDRRGFAEALGCAAAGAPGRERVEARGRGGAWPPVRIVEVVDGGGIQVGVRAGGQRIRDEGDKQSTELYAESLFRWQKGNFVCHFTVSRPNPPAPVGFE